MLSENLRRWQQSGLPRRWVEARQGHWDHAAWEQLLAGLRASEFWPLEAEAVGRTLEELRRLHLNLQRWHDSGWPRRWVEDRAGQWQHGDWLALLDQLRASEYWPLEIEAVGQALEELAQEWRNLRRWQDSGDPRQWVEEHQGEWDHAEWLQLVAVLRQSAFWPINLAAVGRLLEELKLAYWNLRRWRDSGLARRWVEAHQGRWDHAARLTLLDALQKSEFWPIDTVALAQLLEQVRLEQRNLRRWEESGGPRRWVEERTGSWSEADWQTLLAALRQSPYWPLDVAVVRRLLQERKRGPQPDYWRLAGLARLWVEGHQGEWSAADWRALLADMDKHHFGPVEPALLSRVLEEVKADWWRMRPWLRKGQPLRSSEPCRGRDDLPGLLAALRQSEFWPAAPSRREAPARQSA